MQDAMSSPSMPPDEFNRFFNHSLQVGKIAQMISKTLFPGDPGHHGIAYMAGLFHDCGVPVLARKYPDYFEKIVPIIECGKPLELAEETIYATNHSIVGSLIANTWKMPLMVRQAIFYHHLEDLAYQENDEVVELLSTVVLAEKIIYDINQDDGVEELNIYLSAVAEDSFMRILNKLNVSIEQLYLLEQNTRKLCEIIF
jgi:HD-like signal output (HDOD) protein